MSESHPLRALPARPSLEYLKKLAKERLALLRGDQPGAKLAAAQLLIAREHGFASWRAMHEHAERLAADPKAGGNFFAHQSAAKRYAAGRPYFHPLAIEKIHAACGLTTRLGRALDVACGTGQSTLALLDIAQEIVGADAAADMLEQAPLHPRIRYVHASAEELPGDLGEFDLLTVALGFHWLKRDPFMRHAARLTRPGGWLAIYNDGFSGKMHGQPAYEQWNREHYVRRFPTPPRNYSPMTTDEAAGYGFVEQPAIQFGHDVTFTPRELVSYLLTQTNTIAAIERLGGSVTEIADWLLAGVSPLFGGQEAAVFPFWCDIRVYRRRD